MSNGQNSIEWGFDGTSGGKKKPQYAQAQSGNDEEETVEDSHAPTENQIVATWINWVCLKDAASFVFVLSFVFLKNSLSLSQNSL